jgi:Rod binding domain-containing protein
MNISPLNPATSVPFGLADPSLSAAMRPGLSPEAQRQAVAGQFEAILLRQFLSDSVGKMMGGDDGSDSGNGSDGGDSNTQSSVYSYFLTDTLSQKLAAGGGMGLAKIIAQQLAPSGTKTSGPAEATADKPAFPDPLSFAAQVEQIKKP